MRIAVVDMFSMLTISIDQRLTMWIKQSIKCLLAYGTDYT